MRRRFHKQTDKSHRHIHRIQAGQEIYRNDNKVTGANASVHIEREVAFAKRVHAVIMVVKANDPKLQGGCYLETMKIIRECLKKEGG